MISMGGQSRYKVPMFDHNYRVVLAGDRDELIAGCETLDEAEAAYRLAVADHPGRVVHLIQRARIVRSSERD